MQLLRPKNSVQLMKPTHKRGGPKKFLYYKFHFLQENQELVRLDEGVVKSLGHSKGELVKSNESLGDEVQQSVDGHGDTLGDQGADHDAVVPGQDALNSIEVSGLDGSGDGAQERLWVDLDGAVLKNAVVSNEDGLGVVGDDGVDLGGDLGSVQLEGEGLGGHASLGGDVGGGGGDTRSVLGDQASVGDLNLLGDLVGGNGDSEDGGEAGDGEDGSDDDGGLHGLDRPLNVGQLSLEAGHGASSLRFHSDSLKVGDTSVFEFVFVKVRRKRKESLLLFCISVRSSPRINFFSSLPQNPIKEVKSTLCCKVNTSLMGLSNFWF